jgi:hypothetical protein
MGVFERQFSDEGGILVYRRYGKGTAYRVSEAQREEMTAQYLRDFRKSYLIMIALIWFVLGLSVVFLVASNTEPDDDTFWIIAPPLVLVTIWYVWRNRRDTLRPERELSRSTPVGPALSRVDAKRKALSQVSYGKLASAPFLGALGVLVMAKHFDPWTGFSRLVWLFPAAITTLAGVQAYRKFRFEHETN